jgi:hypothetical protein
MMAAQLHFTDHALGSKDPHAQTRERQMLHAVERTSSDVISHSGARPFDAMRAATLISTCLLCQGECLFVGGHPVGPTLSYFENAGNFDSRATVRHGRILGLLHGEIEAPHRPLACGKLALTFSGSV